MKKKSRQKILSPFHYWLLACHYGQVNHLTWSYPRHCHLDLRTIWYYWETERDDQIIWDMRPEGCQDDAREGREASDTHTGSCALCYYHWPDPPFLHVIPCNYNASNWCVHSTSSNTNCRFEFLHRALMYEAEPISLWFSWNGDIGALTITISDYRCQGGVDEGSNHLCKDVRCWVFVDIIVVSPAPIVSTLSHILSVTFSLRPH